MVCVERHHVACVKRHYMACAQRHRVACVKRHRTDCISKGNLIPQNNMIELYPDECTNMNCFNFKIAITWTVLAMFIAMVLIAIIVYLRCYQSMK